MNDISCSQCWLKATRSVTQEIIIGGVNPGDKSAKVFHLDLPIGLMLHRFLPENRNHNAGGWNAGEFRDSRALSGKSVKSCQPWDVFTLAPFPGH